MSLLKMKPGEVAGPIKTLYGYHIVKLDDVQPEKQLSFEESAANIKAQLTEEKRTKLYDELDGGHEAEISVADPLSFLNGLHETVSSVILASCLVLAGCGGGQPIVWQEPGDRSGLAVSSGPATGSLSAHHCRTRRFS